MAAAHCALVLPALEAMASKVVQLGPDPGRAAAFKLMGNLGLELQRRGHGVVMFTVADGARKLEGLPLEVSRSAPPPSPPAPWRRPMPPWAD